MPLSPFPFSDTNKRYHTWDYFLKHRYGGKVLKVPLNARFGCPNLDGTKGIGGCTFCSASGSGEFAGNPSLDLPQQFQQQRKSLSRKWPQANQYIGYFQAFSNTYAPLPVLQQAYESILELPGVVGLSIATRPDCLPDDVVEYLACLNRKTDLYIELGLQSVHDKTARRIHRGHYFKDFLEGLYKLTNNNIPVCVHIINGLPGETAEDMLETVRVLSDLPVHSVKIHLLHVLRGTQLEQEFLNGEFQLLEQEQYVQIVCDQIELLPPEIAVQRITGDGKAEDLIGPLWSKNKKAVLAGIDKEFVRRDSWQGKASTSHNPKIN